MPQQLKYIFLIIFVISIPFVATAQQYDLLFDNLSETDDGESKIELINELINGDIYAEFPDTLALLHDYKAAILFEQTISIEAAIEELNKGIEIISYENYPEVWITLWYYKGFYYRKWDKYEEAKNALSEVLKYPKNNDYLWDATIQLGKTYKDRGEFSLALDYYRKAITLSGNDKDNLSTTYEVISFVYLIMETEEGAKNALPWLDKLIALLKTMGGQENFLASMTYNKACAYMTLDDLKNARREFEESERIMNACCDDNDFKSLILESKAVLLKEEGKYEDAIDHFERSLALYQHSFDLTRSDGLASTYNSMAETYQEMGDLEKALKYIDDALDYRLSGIDRDIESQIVTEELIIANGEKHYLIDELLTKGKILEESAIANKSPSMREKAIEAFLFADIVVDKMRFQHLEESTKQFWREKTTEVYQNLVKNYVEIDNIEKAFYYAEKSKYLLMGEHLVKHESKDLLHGIPEKLRSEYAQNQKDISLQLSQIKNSQLLHLDREIDSVELMLIPLRKQEDDILSLIKKDHPEFFTKNFWFEIATIKDVQRDLLSPKETLIEYFLSDSALFIFAINKNDSQLSIVPINGKIELASLITNLRNNITHPDRYEQKYLHRYSDNASALYDILIAPVKGILKESITIVADNAIALVPFSALLSERVEDAKLSTPLIQWPYLIYNHQVSFLRSASLELLNYKTNTDISYDKEILAFNPSFTSSDGRKAMQRGDTIRGSLLPLLGATEEINFAKNLFKGDFFLKTEATEQNLKNALTSSYSIFHIASHAIVNDNTPHQSKLVLSSDETDDGMLYTSEIDNLNLKSDLVILSACNTGVGQVTNGEGINSLARSFANAGSQNMLMSLWPVSDRSTTSLIKEYYKKLTAGNSKSASLNEAKNTFLDNVPAAYHHPYFWGGFVYYGDDAPLRLSGKSFSISHWIFAIIWVGLLGLVYFFRGKKTAS